MSFITDMFAAPGSGYAATQNKQNEQVSQMGAQVIPILSALIKMQGEFAANPELEAKRQQAINQIVNLMSIGNATGQAQLQKNAIDSNAAQSSRMSDLLARGAGLGAGGRLGGLLSNANQAATQKSAIDTRMADPSYLASLIQQRLSAIASAQGIPSMSAGGSAGQVANLIYGRPTVQVQPGFGQILGNMAGSFLGGGGGTQTAPTGAGSVAGTYRPNYNLGYSVNPGNPFGPDFIPVG